MSSMDAELKRRAVSRLLADDYSQRILAQTFNTPMSAQRLSRVCGIPIAACYRRIHDLETVGLIGIEDEMEVYKGRRVRMYKCRLRTATIKFANGRFAVKYHTEENGGGNNAHTGQGPVQIEAG
jgi:predicted ArsR family transcriptional regulator